MKKQTFWKLAWIVSSKFRSDKSCIVATKNGSKSRWDEWVMRSLQNWRKYHRLINSSTLKPYRPWQTKIVHVSNEMSSKSWQILQSYKLIDQKNNQPLQVKMGPVSDETSSTSKLIDLKNSSKHIIDNRIEFHYHSILKL